MASVVVPVTSSETPTPLTVSDPPVIDSPPPSVELATTVNDPPVIAIGSAAVIEWTDWFPELIVTDGVAPFTSITTSSLEPGTLPVLQSAAVFQLPPVGLIQSTSESNRLGSRISIPTLRDRRNNEGIPFRLALMTVRHDASLPERLRDVPTDLRTRMSFGANE